MDIEKYFSIDNETQASVKDSFVRIAETLFYKLRLKINQNYFDFLDVEFYYYSTNHKDGFTFPHNVELGKLRAHDYGVDISLGNTDNNYGGILLRGLIKNNNEIIHKPAIVKEIINSLNLEINIIEWIEKEQHSIKYTSTPRMNLGDPKTKKDSMYYAAKYRFILLNDEYLKQLKGKSIILAQSELEDSEINKILGYKMNRNKIKSHE